MLFSFKAWQQVTLMKMEKEAWRRLEAIVMDIVCLLLPQGRPRRVQKNLGLIKICTEDIFFQPLLVAYLDIEFV